jgi:predicted protein tyrosine phosphatase
MKKILTVCSANINRSTTAAFMLKVINSKNQVVSRGSSQAACRIHGGTYCTAEDVTEADEILCMEERNRKELLAAHGNHIDAKISVLGIEDKYKAFQPELITELTAKLW